MRRSIAHWPPSTVEMHWALNLPPGDEAESTLNLPPVDSGRTQAPPSCAPTHLCRASTPPLLNLYWTIITTELLLGPHWAST